MNIVCSQVSTERDSMNSQTTRDMTTGNTTKLLLKFSLPMLVGNLFQQVYNMADSIIVGKYVGKNALAAVGTTGPINYFMFSLILGLTAGVSIVISQYYGAKDDEYVKKAIATAVYMITGAAIIMGIIGFLLAKPILILLNTPDIIMNDAIIYLRISMIGIIGVAGYNGIASILRALGDSVTPLIFLAMACILNIALDLLFVLVLHWDVPGVAIATIISQIISAISCIIYTWMKTELLRIPKKELKPSKTILKKCFQIGIPVALQNAFVSCSTMVLQSVINSYGEVVIAAATASGRVEQLILQPGTSVGVAVATFTGQNIGAGNTDRVKEGFKSATKIIFVFSIIMLPLIYFGGGSIMNLFTSANDTAVAKIGLEALRVPCFFYFFVGMIFVSRNLLSGAGDVKIPMLMGFTEVVCRVIFANLLSIYMGYSGIWWATGITWFITAIVGCTRYFSGKWKDKSIVDQSEFV